MVADTEGKKMFSKWSLFMQSRNYIALQLSWFAVQLSAVATTLATGGKQKTIGTILNSFVFIGSNIAIATFNMSIAYCMFA